MSEASDLYTKAQQQYRIADHLLTRTFRYVEEPKLLIAVLENLFLAMSNAMAALLQYEVQNKRLSSFGKTFDDKLNAIKLQVTKRYHIEGKHLTLAQDLKNFVLMHKKSQMEFSRKGAFVICGENYQLHTVSPRQAQEYSNQAKVFIDRIGLIIT